MADPNLKQGCRQFYGRKEERREKDGYGAQKRGEREETTERKEGRERVRY